MGLRAFHSFLSTNAPLYPWPATVSARRSQVMVPVLLGATQLARVEPLPDSLPPGLWDGQAPEVANVMWQIDEVFKKGGLSTFKAMEKGWVSK